VGGFELFHAVALALDGTLVMSDKEQAARTARSNISVSCQVMPRPAPVVSLQTINGVTYVTWKY
jgi:hypothetical protein